MVYVWPFLMVSATAASEPASFYAAFPDTSGLERVVTAVVEVGRSNGDGTCRVLTSTGDADADLRACRSVFKPGAPRVGKGPETRRVKAWIVPSKPAGYVSAVPIGRRQCIDADDYPDESLAENEQGVIVTRILISESGRPMSCKTLKSSGFPRLDQTVCRAVKMRFSFQPAMLDGVPVKEVRLIETAFTVE